MPLSRESSAHHINVSCSCMQTRCTSAALQQCCRAQPCHHADCNVMQGCTRCAWFVGLHSSADRQSLQESSSTLSIHVLIGVCCCRWNTLAAHDVGLTLQLLPMLLGFFTYKAAVIAKTGLSLLESISKESSKAATSDASQPSLQQADVPIAEQDQRKSLDATYNQRVLTR